MALKPYDLLELEIPLVGRSLVFIYKSESFTYFETLSRYEKQARNEYVLLYADEPGFCYDQNLLYQIVS